MHDPLAQGETQEGLALDAAIRIVVQILDGGAGVFQLRKLQKAGLAPIGAGVYFALDQHPQALLEAHGVDLGLGELFLQGGDETLQFQAAQLVGGVAIEHGSVLR